jgi:predicted ATPase/class 3 adenylate cyclase
MPKPLVEQINDLRNAITAQEAMRAVMGDAVVDTTLGVLRGQLAELEKQIIQPDATPHARRKLVTVLFADISGFTALSENMDAEDVTNLVNRLWARLDKIIREFGGEIDKHIGDAVMAIWGADAAREDDAERAIRAALKMQETFKENAGQLPISIKVGINSGQVLLSEIGTQGEYTAMGDTVNTASRLVNLAQANEILVSHDTYQLVRGVFDIQVQSPITVKGKSEPLQTYLILRVRPRAFRLGKRGVEGVSTRMVGREAEFQSIQAVVEQCVQNRRVSVAVVKGDAGLGKSRLIYELEAWLDTHPHDFYMFKGRADEETTSLPYSLLRDVFSERFQIMDNDTQAEARAKLVQGVTALIGERGEERAMFMGELLGFDFSESPYVRGIRNDARQIRSLSFNHIAQFFVELSANAPLVLLLDDIHWADNGSLELVEYLAKLEIDLPLFIFCAARPSLDETHPGWGDNFPLCEVVTIKSLDLNASRELASNILQNVARLPSELVEIVAKNAEGNPFYLEELIKVLIEDGVIIKGEENWQIVPHRLTQLRVPATLTGILQARLDRLPATENEVLERAAVIGRTFWDAAVEAMHGSENARTLVGGQDVHLALSALRTKELVFAHQPSTFAGAQEFIFKHAILREVTYERVLKAKRKLYHRLAATWLIQQSGERIGEYLGLIAQHYELAGDTTQAVDFLDRAAELSMQLSAYREALSASERGLAILATSENKNAALRTRMLFHIGAAHLWLTDYKTARARFEECLALMQTAQDPALEAKVLARLGRIDLEQNSYESSRAFYQRSLEIARQVNDLELAAYVLASLGYTHHYQGNYLEAEKYGKEGYALARQIDDAIAQAFSLNMLAMSSANRGAYDACRNYHLQGIEICKTSGDRYGLARAYSNLSELLRIQKLYTEAMPHTIAGIQITRELGNRFALSIMLVNLVYSQAGQGEIQSAYASVREALQLNIENNLKSWVIFSLVGYAAILQAEGKREQSLQILGLCLKHPETNSDTHRDIELILADLKAVRTDDIDAGLARGDEIDLNKAVLMALGG